MTVLAGYTKRPEPKWPYVLAVIAAVALIFFLLLIFPTPKKSSENNEGTPKTEKAKEEKNKPAPILTKEAVVAPKVEPKKTISVSSIGGTGLTMKNEDGKLYCYSQLDLAKIPQTVRHVWFDPRGREVAEIELHVTRRPQQVWSYVSSYGNPAGTWEVQVKASDGTIIARKSFSVAGQL